MKKTKHILLILALLAIAAIFYLSADKIKSGGKALKKDIGIKTSASAIVSGVTYVKTVKDFTEFKIRAKSAEYFKDNGTTAFDGVDAEFFAKNGKGYRLTGKSGEYDSEKENIIIKGDVILLSGDGYELKTDSLSYSHDDKTLNTDDPVTVKRGGLTLEGIGMTLDMQDEKLKILKNVKGHIAGS